VLGVGAARPQKNTFARDFAAAERAYDNFEFDKAIPLFERALKQDRFTDDRLKQLARLHLAFSLFIQGKEDAAERALDRLFAENADYCTDGRSTTPHWGRFFNKVHAAPAGAGQSTPEPRGAPPAPPPVAAAPPPAPAAAPSSAPSAVAPSPRNPPKVEAVPPS